MSEETTNAAVSAPLGVLTSVVVSSAFGFCVLLAFLFSIQNFQATLAAPQPVLQIMIDVFGIKGAQIAMALILLCVWNCGLFSLTSNSRMMYAFARDRGLPRMFAVVDEKLRCPVRTGEFLRDIMIGPRRGPSAEQEGYIVLILQLSFSGNYASLVIRYLGFFVRPLESWIFSSVGRSNKLSECQFIMLT